MAKNNPENKNLSLFRAKSRNGIFSKLKTFVTILLVTGAINEIVAQHRDGQSSLTVNGLQVDAHLDDGQWTTISEADREAGLTTQAWVMGMSLHPDMRTTGIFPYVNALHLPNSTLSSTGDKNADLIAWEDHLRDHPGSYDINNYQAWFNSEHYGAGSNTGPFYDWVPSVIGSGIFSEYLLAHEATGAMAGNPGDYSYARHGVNFHVDYSSLGGPDDQLHTDGETPGYAMTGGGGKFPPTARLKNTISPTPPIVLTPRSSTILSISLTLLMEVSPLG